MPRTTNDQDIKFKSVESLLQTTPDSGKKHFLFQTDFNSDTSEEEEDEDDCDRQSTDPTVVLTEPACCDKSTATTRLIAEAHRSLADLYDRLVREQEEHKQHRKLKL